MNSLFFHDSDDDDNKAFCMQNTAVMREKDDELRSGAASRDKMKNA